MKNNIHDVFIAGQLGKALYQENNHYYMLDIDDLGNPIEVTETEIAALAQWNAEFYPFIDNRITLRKVKQELKTRTHGYRTLSLISSGLNPKLSGETRKVAVKCANDLLKTSDVKQFVENRLLARPLPDQVPIDDVQNNVKNDGCHQVAKIYSMVSKHQEAIKQLQTIWRQVANSHITSEEINNIENQLIESGIFSRLVKALTGQNQSELGTCFFNLSKNIAVGDMKQEAAETLIKDLEITLAQKFFANQTPQVMTASPEEQIDVEEDEITRLITRYYSETNKSKGKKDRRKKRRDTAEVAKGKVDGQISRIVDFMQQDKEKQFLDYLKALVQSQLEQDRPDLLLKSLCNLAKPALDSDLFYYVEKLLYYGDRLLVDDAVFSCTKAHFQVKQGNLHQALELYQQNISRFPDEVVALCGKAEVLKELCRLEDALKLYEESVERFPNSVVARNGKANVLICLGQYDPALSILSTLDPVTKEDWITHHIGSMAYLRKGLYDEAIERFEYGAEKLRERKNKQYFYYINALAMAKMKKKQYGESISILQKNVISLSEYRKERAQQQLLLAHSLAGNSQLKEAKETLQNIPEDAIKTPQLKQVRAKIIDLFGLSDSKQSAALSEMEKESLEKALLEEEERMIMMAA